ncbi:MAG: histidinol dehydrogenase [Candidatus Lokiarchaeota archaeon]|nr:histidinol dehydrogenase [Candidatus Lokiarchaeota archaeon]MBD3202325.1 histidinol dehydrogenase [Candidatus Lokiarchaeota archaeon]
MKKFNLNEVTKRKIIDSIPRTSSQINNLQYDVMEIINNVILDKDAALVRYTEEFDGVSIPIEKIKVSKEEIEDSYEKISDDLLDALRYAKKNLLKFHDAQIPEDWVIEIEENVNIGQIYRPIESVGIYIPGGRAIYPSTVLMAAVPAKVTGVEKIILCSPPQKNGNIAPEILVAANECEIANIFKVGGVQAIAAMAHGTESIPNVLKVIGPGNKWVNAAKVLLSNIIAIDSPAGPSEILIIADLSAKSSFVIRDFLSQIEHDPDNIGIIVTPSDDLIEKIENEIGEYISNSKRKAIIETALKNSIIVKTDNLDECVELSNEIGPEHLEIMTENPKELMKHVRNAGAIFLGSFSPVPLGDYSAGTNHILPTGGNAKVYSGLSVFDFMKSIDYLECNKNGLEILSKSAMIMAEFEELYEHSNAIKERLNGQK